VEHKLHGATIFTHNYQAKIPLFSWWTFVVPRNKKQSWFSLEIDISS